MTPELDHPDLTAIADGWAPPLGVIPAPTIFDPPQTRPRLRNGADAIVPYCDAQCTISDTVRVKIFYDPSEDDDIYVNERDIDLPFDIADAEIEKTAGVSDPVAGDELTYTITVTNHGPDDIVTAIITDTLPMSVTYVSDTDVCMQLMPGELRCSLGPLAAGASDSFALTVRLDPSTPPGTTYQGSVGAACAGVAIGGTGVLTCALGDMAAGESTSFGIRLRVSPGLADGAPLFNSAVVGSDLPDPDGSDNSDTSGLPQIVCSLGNLAAGASVDVVITVQVNLDAPTGSTLLNAAIAGSDEPDPDPGNDDDDVPVEVTSAADLSVTKSAEGEVTTTGSPPGTVLLADAVTAGRRLTYTLTVANAGPSTATGVTLTDTLPAGVSHVSDDAGCDTSGAPEIVCSLPDIPSGGSVEVVIVVDVSAAVAGGATLTNTAVVGAVEPDADPADNDALNDTTVQAASDLSIDKSASQAAVTTGDLVTFTLSVQNLGPSNAPSVTVLDTLPISLTYVSDTDSCVVQPPAGGDLTCTLGPLAAGDMTSFEIVAQVEPGLEGQTIQNTAVVSLTGPGVDPDPSNNASSASIKVVGMVDMRVTAGAVPLTVDPGEAVTYATRVENVGATTAHTVVLTDTLPGGITPGPAPAGCSFAGQVLSCSLGDFSPAQLNTIAYTGTVDIGLSPGTERVNAAEVGSAGIESNPADNTDSVTVTVGTGLFGFAVTLDAEGRAGIDWIDEAVDESVFDIQFSAGGSRWVTVATVTSTTIPGTTARSCSLTVSRSGFRTSTAASASAAPRPACAPSRPSRTVTWKRRP